MLCRVRDSPRACSRAYHENPHSLELTLLDNNTVAVFCHASEACGPLYVHKLDPKAVTLRSCPATYLCPPQPTALTRIPMLCSQEAICDLMICNPKELVDTWVRHAHSVPAIGTLLVTVHPDRTTTSERLDACIANALVLATMLGPTLIERAEHRLLQAALACNALPSDVPLQYVPGKGFVVHGLSSNASVDTQMMADAQNSPLGVVDGDFDDASSVDSSGVEVSSAHDEPSTSDVDAAPRGRQGKRRRCQQDTLSSVSRNDSSEDEDDREAVFNCRRRLGQPTVSNTAATSSAPGPSSSGGLSGGGPKSKQAMTSGQYLMYMHREMAQVRNPSVGHIGSTATPRRLNTWFCCALRWCWAASGFSWPPVWPPQVHTSGRRCCCPCYSRWCCGAPSACLATQDPGHMPRNDWRRRHCCC